MQTDVSRMDGPGINILVKCTSRFSVPFAQRFCYQGYFYTHACQIWPVRENPPISEGQKETRSPILCWRSRVPCIIWLLSIKGSRALKYL